MILFVLTTDGESREDNSVLYARYLLVDESEERRQEVAIHLCRIFGGGVGEVLREGVSLVQVDREDDAAMEMIWHPRKKLLGKLADAGIKATELKANFVSAEYR